MSENKRAYLELHIAVLLYGLTAVLGDLIQLPAVILVWWRVLITSFSMLFLLRLGRDLFEIKWSVARPIMLVGFIVATHWICFYGSVKLANASVALICMATTSIFTALLEPWIMKRRIDPLEIILAIVIIPAMVFVVGSLDFSMRTGVMVGFASAFLAALFGTLNKRYVDTVSPYQFTFLQLGSAWVFISLIFVFANSMIDFSVFLPPTAWDWAYILMLALFCTTLAFILNLRALSKLSAYATNLVINLEPLYGIILAAAILKEYEQLDGDFYIGGGIILAVVLGYPYLKERFSTT